MTARFARLRLHRCCAGRGEKNEVKMSESLESMVYQFRVVLVGISPLIWRRLLVQSDTTLADLHQVLQISFDWSDFHLHQFLIHAKRYGQSRSGGVAFTDDPHEIKLADCGLRVSEKFLYEYDFGDHWQHLIRVEAILQPQRSKTYPLCIGGKRSAPPEDCGGARRFMELRRQHSPFYLLQRVAEIVEDEDADRIAELRELSCWMLIDRFDRRCVNHRLKWHFAAWGKTEITTERGGAQ